MSFLLLTFDPEKAVIFRRNTSAAEAHGGDTAFERIGAESFV